MRIIIYIEWQFGAKDIHACEADKTERYSSASSDLDSQMSGLRPLAKVFGR